MAEPMEQGGGAPASAKTPADGQAPESTDYANYFCTYSYLYHQVRSRRPWPRRATPSPRDGAPSRTPLAPRTPSSFFRNSFPDRYRALRNKVPK